MIPLRCLVPECGGAIQYRTDGIGHALGWCTACEARVDEVRALRAIIRQGKRVFSQWPGYAMPERIPIMWVEQ